MRTCVRCCLSERITAQHSTAQVAFCQLCFTISCSGASAGPTCHSTTITTPPRAKAAPHSPILGVVFIMVVFGEVVPEPLSFGWGCLQDFRFWSWGLWSSRMQFWGDNLQIVQNRNHSCSIRGRHTWEHHLACMHAAFTHLTVPLRCTPLRVHPACTALSSSHAQCGPSTAAAADPCGWPLCRYTSGRVAIGGRVQKCPTTRHDLLSSSTLQHSSLGPCVALWLKRERG
jgi:hypothetical protein